MFETVLITRCQFKIFSYLELDGIFENCLLKYGNIVSDLNALLIFAKVVDATSFSEAARRLAMPISTVSRKIAELEDQLGVRLLERSTRQLRLTDVGAEVLEYAQQSVEVSEAVASVVSNQLTEVKGTLRLSAPPSIADSVLAPLITAFQASYPEVHVHVLVTDRFVDHIAEGIDLVFRVGPLEDSTLVARKMLRYRHQLVASPEYLKNTTVPNKPKDLLNHRLLAFSFWNPQNSWTFFKSKTMANGRSPDTSSQPPIHHVSKGEYRCV